MSGNVDLDTLGQIAYGAYWEQARPEGYIVADWADLNPRLREAWRAAADAVRMYEHLRRPGNPAAQRRRIGWPQLAGYCRVTTGAASMSWND